MFVIENDRFERELPSMWNNKGESVKNVKIMRAKRNIVWVNAVRGPLLLQAKKLSMCLFPIDLSEIGACGNAIEHGALSRGSDREVTYEVQSFARGNMRGEVRRNGWS